MEYFGTLQALSSADLETLVDVPDVGPIVAQSIVDFFTHDENLALINKLRQVGVEWQEQQRDISDDAGTTEASEKPLANLTAVITGSLESMPRDEAKQKLQALGVKVTGSVSKKTTFVLVGEAPGSKATKAEALGIALFDENDFLEILEDPKKIDTLL